MRRRQPAGHRQRLVSRWFRNAPSISGTLAAMADRNLEVYLTWCDGAVVLTPRGEIDLLTVPAGRRAQEGNLGTAEDGSSST